MKNIDTIWLKKALLWLILVLASQYTVAQDDKAIARAKAKYIFDFPKYVVWENEEFEEMKIGVIGGSRLFITQLTDICQKGYPDGTFITIKEFSSLKDLSRTHMLYVDPSWNDSIPQIKDKIDGSNTLLITDRYYNKKGIMINFYDPDIDGNIYFEINLVNIYKENISISLRILSQGGNEVDLRDLYKEVEEELQLEKQRVEAQKQDLESLRIDIENQRKLINQQLADIQNQEKTIEAQTEKIVDQRTEFDQLSTSINQQKELLSIRLIELKQQELKLKRQQNLIVYQQKSADSLSIILSKLNLEILAKQDTIDVQKEDIEEQTVRIEKQQIALYAFIGVLILILLMTYAIYYGYRIKTQANKILEIKNTEINQQKDKIQQQADQLEYTNHELVKLSIVASETQNAVSIMDEKGNFEWINAGFTRMYGYTLQLLKHELGSNIREVSKHTEIEDILEKCLVSKNNQVYESLFTSRTGKAIWIQSTLTPIFNAEAELIKLVLIDTEINEIKAAQQEITRQKETVEMQNLKITDSINYAQNIQEAILPTAEDMNQHFNHFMIYRPRDIVSGDFPWYSIKQTAGGKVQKLIAAVDCTGHGIPGAFMSLIGSRLLNEIVSSENTVQPNEILDKLDAAVKKALKQHITDNRDGMDVAMCLLEEDGDKTKVTFCGAKRPLIYVCKDDNNVVTIKGTRRSVGGIRMRKAKEIEFENTELVLSKGDMLYLTSDGYTDQNDKERKSLGQSQFTEYVSIQASKSLHEQKAFFENTLDNFMQGVEQRDDITLIGIKL